MRPVCLLMIFLPFTQLYKDKLMILLKDPSIEKALLTLHIKTETHVLLWKNLKKYHAWSCPKVCDALNFLLDNVLFDLAQSCLNKKLGFPWALIVFPWLSIDSSFAMRETL